MKRIGTSECAFCGRRVMVTKDGLLQRHQIKASRKQVACSGSGTLALRTAPRVEAETLQFETTENQQRKEAR